MPQLTLQIDPDLRQALHAPDKIWKPNIWYPFNNSESGDPSECLSLILHPADLRIIGPLSQALLPELSGKVSMVFYSGNDDAFVGHRATERTSTLIIHPPCR